MKLSPFRIAVIYLIIAVLWIIATDTALQSIVSDAQNEDLWNITKGLFFVTVTAGSLFYLIKRFDREVTRERRKLEKKDRSLTLALQSNKMATWEYYPDEDRYITSSNHNGLFDFPQSKNLSIEDVFSRVHPEDLDHFKRNVENTLQKHENLNVEYRVVLPENTVKWFWTRGIVNIREGQLESVTGITSDITESKTLKRKLDLEKEKFESLFDRIPVLITVYDSNLEIEEVNNEFEQVMGWNPLDDPKSDMPNRMYPDEQAGITARNHIKNPDGGWKEFDVKTKDGAIRHQLWTSVHLSDSTIVGIGYDITERKQLEIEEKKYRDRLIDIFNKLPIFINVIDKDLRIVESNNFVVERLGYNNDEMMDEDVISKIIRNGSSKDRANTHISRADDSWKDFDIYTKSGDRLKTSWMNMRLNDSYILGVGLDLTLIKELEEQLSLAVKGGNVGLWDFFLEKGRIEINDEWAGMLGYSKEELEPMTYEKWLGMTHPEDSVKSEDLMNRHFAGELPHYSNEIRMRHKDGHWVWMIDRGVVAERDEEGNVTRITGTHIDITERKELEDEIKVSRTRLKQATDSANVGLWEWNPMTGEVTIDEMWASLVGYTLDELQPVDINTWNRLVHKDDLKRFEKTVEEYFAGERELYEIEVRMRHKDGHWVWILDRGKNIDWDEQGNPIKMIGTHVDITALKENEKRLTESEQLLIETQRVANLGTFTEDLNSNELQTSKILNQMFWLAENDTLTSDKLIERLHPDFKYAADTYQKAIKSGEPYEAEFKIQNPIDRRERWIYEKANVETDRSGNPVRVIGTMLDITRAKEQEIRIRRTLSQLKKAEEIAEIGYWEKNLDTGKLFWGNNKYALLDADSSNGPLSRREFFERIHPDDKKATYDAYLDAEINGRLETTFRYKLGNGTYRTFREKAETIKDDVTGHQILRGVSMDITSLREVESQLEDEQTRLRIITGLVSDVIWEWNFEYDTITWSDGMHTVFGYQMDDLPEGKESWTDHLFPDDKDRVIRSIQDAMKSDRSYWEEEYRFIDSDGSTRYVLDQGYIFRDENGYAVKMVGAMIDQTESKQSEMILSSQARLLEDISDAVIATNEKMEIVSWNRAAELMYGWSEKDVMGAPVSDIITTEYDDENEAFHFQKLIEKEEWNGEVVQYSRSGKPMSILSSVRVITDSEGNFDGTVAVNKDITALKEIRKRLNYEQRRFEYATSVVSDAIWDANPNDGTVWWSEGLESHYMHKVPDPENGYEVWKNNLHPDDRDRVINDMKHAEESGKIDWNQEYRFYRGDGSLATVLDRAFILRNDKGEILRVIGAMNDITLQKEAEQELKRSEQQYRLLYELSPLPMYIFDKESFRFLSVNEALTDLFGYSEDEFMQMTIFDLFLPDDQEEIRAEAEQDLQKARSGFDVWRQKTRNGEVKLCEISGSDIYFKEKQQRLVLTLDITEQREAEERAIKAVVEGEERERHRIANELHDGLGQYLSAANMHLNTVYSDIESIAEPTDKSFKTGLQMLKHAISETRSISHNLLPKAIQDYGLKVAVKSLVNEMQSTQDTAIHLFQHFEDETIPGNIQINIFRIIQEALNNAIKHSKASIVNINLVYSDNELICAIEDNGIGFDPSNVSNEGLGLQSMKTRVAAMSGNIDIDSKQNMGTLITAIIPIK